MKGKSSSAKEEGRRMKFPVRRTSVLITQRTKGVLHGRTQLRGAA